MCSKVSTPLALRSNPDPDSRSPRDLVRRRQPAIFHVEARPAKICLVLGKRDPHRHRQISGATTQLVRRELRLFPGSASLHAPRAPLSHHVHALERFQRAKQHGCRRSFCFGDSVDERMDAVIEVDVGEAGRPVERCVARRRSRRGMARGIRFTDVRFDFDDDAARADAAPVVHENFPDQIARDVERRPAIKLARKFPPRPHLPAFPARPALPAFAYRPDA